MIKTQEQMYNIHQVGVPALGQLAAWWPTIDANRSIDESHQFILMMRFIAFSECKEQSRNKAAVYLYGKKSKKSTDQQSTRDTMKRGKKKRLASDPLLLKNGT